MLAGIRFVFIVTGFVLLVDALWLRKPQIADSEPLELEPIVISNPNDSKLRNTRKELN